MIHRLVTWLLCSVWRMSSRMCILVSDEDPACFLSESRFMDIDETFQEDKIRDCLITMWCIFLYVSGLVTATDWASLDLKLFIWDYFWAALPLRIICASKMWFTTFASIYLFPLTQTVIFQLVHHQLVNLTLFACILLEVLQTCPMWRDTEFPSMQGRRYALTQHAVQLQKADFTAAEKQNNLNSSCDILLWFLCSRLEISQCAFLSIVAWRVLDWKRRPGWQRGMSWCRQRTRLIIHTAMKLAKVREC